MSMVDRQTSFQQRYQERGTGSGSYKGAGAALPADRRSDETYYF